MAKISFNARIEKGENGWYVGQIEEMPEVISQGKTIEELNENLMDAFRIYESNQWKANNCPTSP